jgi:hypothetical protein
LRFK